MELKARANKSYNSIAKSNDNFFFPSFLNSLKEKTGREETSL